MVQPPEQNLGVMLGEDNEGKVEEKAIGGEVKDLKGQDIGC